MPKTLALETKLYMEDPAATWTAIGNITSITSPGPTKGETEVTDFDSTAREFLGTLPDNGEIAYSGWFIEAQAGQEKMWTDANSATATARAWRLDFVRQDTRFTFSGYVRSHVISASGPDEAYVFNGAIRVTGAVVKTVIP